jgi:2-oxoglutarate dehydrogenase E1 component
VDFGVNQSLVEELFLRYREDPATVDPAWRRHFDGLSDGERTEWVRSIASSPRAGVSFSGNHGTGGGVHVERGMRGGNGARGGNGRHAASAESSPVAPSPGASAPDTSTARPSRARPAAATHLSAEAASEYQERVTALVNGYRSRGHRCAQIDPLGLGRQDEGDLALERFGLADCDPEMRFATGNLAAGKFLPLREIVARLKETYTRSIGVEYRFVEEPEIRAWVQAQMERTSNRLALDEAQQVRLLSKLTDAEIFEQFLHTKYIGAKRFSLEGAESLIPLLDLVVEHAGEHRVEEIVIGMAHRGRLNVLANVMEKKLEEIFAAFEDETPESLLGRGDVKYHLGYSSDRLAPNGHPVHLTLAFNPSHLEWVNPVVEGRVRAKQERRGDKERKRVMPLLIHGDAAIAGQGIVQETINLGALRGYGTGGTLHVVVNNQIGFTTVWEDSRSTRYCTDVMRMLGCPIFHVNGEDPEAVAQVVRVAIAFRQRYGRHVVIDLYCYRRYGHNEADEPRFTQPVMYAAIDAKPSVRKVYIDKLVALGAVTEAQAAQIERTRRGILEAALERTRGAKLPPTVYAMQGLWAGYRGGRDVDCPEVATGVADDRLRDLWTRACTVPDGFRVHPKLARLLDMRLEQRDEKRPIDWGTAEMLAYASLVSEGAPVRLSGQDSRRGTFSHRHAVLHDHVTGKRHTPLAFLAPGQGRFEVWDSPLSEAGVLGFEYGYSLDSPDALVVWEAQFGDFANSAQVIVDQFLSSSEDKWYRLSGLVLLLPHGYEGQGPEHSSARLERFLNLCAEDNLQVCNLTTPAQFFHALRRQVRRPYRKPLVVMSPKSLLRSPAAVSSVSDLVHGRFEPIVPDGTADPARVRRVLLCSGKVYYDLDAARREARRDDIAIVRLEMLYPLRTDRLREVLAPYRDGVELVWVQEEPWNMGAWYYLQARLPDFVGERYRLRCVARPESASPATGSHAAHKIEQAQLVSAALGPAA